MTHHTDGNTHAINKYLDEVEAYEERKRLERLVLCETCGAEIDPDDEQIDDNGDCEACQDANSTDTPGD